MPQLVLMPAPVITTIRRDVARLLAMLASRFEESALTVSNGMAANNYLLGFSDEVNGENSSKALVDCRSSAN